MLFAAALAFAVSNISYCFQCLFLANEGARIWRGRKTINFLRMDWSKVPRLREGPSINGPYVSMTSIKVPPARCNVCPQLTHEHYIVLLQQTLYLWKIKKLTKICRLAFQIALTDMAMFPRRPVVIIHPLLVIDVGVLIRILRRPSGDDSLRRIRFGGACPLCSLPLGLFLNGPARLAATVVALFGTRVPILNAALTVFSHVTLAEVSCVPLKWQTTSVRCFVSERRVAGSICTHAPEQLCLGIRLSGAFLAFLIFVGRRMARIPEMLATPASEHAEFDLRQSQSRARWKRAKRRDEEAMMSSC